MSHCRRPVRLALHALALALATTPATVWSDGGIPGAFPESQAFVEGLPNGIASGDVTPRSAVLMARSDLPALLRFEWSRWEESGPDGQVHHRLRWVTDPAEPAKVIARHLEPGSEYRYAVTNLRTGERIDGRFVTPALPGAKHGLTFGAAGDWQQAPPYPALRNVPERDLDLILKLGDTIYADLETPALPYKDQARTLEDFRIKHAEVASARPEAPDVNVMPAVTRAQSLLATIDDHELVDNFAGGAAPGESPDAPDVNPDEPPLFTDPVPFVNQTQAYKDALQAFQEYHPVRETKWRFSRDSRVEDRPRLYRFRRYGDDAAFIILDSRSFRDAQLDPVADPQDPVAIADFIAATFDPTRTLLGKPQLRALQADLLRAQRDGVTWKFVVIPEPIQNFGVVNAEDRFEGYAAERTELLAYIDLLGIDNVVFLAGDFHGTLVNNLTYTSPTGEQIPTGAFEIVTGPVSFFDGRFGPAVVNIAAGVGLLTLGEVAFYNALPVAPDSDDVPNDKDDFLEGLINAQLTPLGYDPIGLDANLEVANGLIDATLVQGDYVAAHHHAWAELDVDAETQRLTVTIWGTQAHSEAELLADPEAVTALEPQVIAKFTVDPQKR